MTRKCQRGPYHCGLSGVDRSILERVSAGPCHGAEQLAIDIVAYNWSWVRRRMERLRQAGLIDVEVPVSFGRGHRIEIRMRGR